MRLTLTVLGHTLELSLEAAPGACACEDVGCSLDGGTTASDRIDAGPTDIHLGFTGGWDDGGE